MVEKKDKKPAKGAAKADAAPKAKAASPKAKAEKAAAPKQKAKAKAKAEKPAPAREEVSGIVNTENQKVKDLVLSPAVFGVEVNEHLLYEAVKQYRAGAREGTHMTKNRALVSGSGRKPWRQKGTGRARVGEIRTPLWRHGGTVFGPVPRDYSYSMPKKARAAALRSALSQRAKEGALKVVDEFGISRPKTKVLKGILDKLGVTGRTVLVDHEPPDALVLSGRNIPGVTVLDPAHLTVYHVLDCKTLLLSQEALGKLEERLAP
jgi:large subunit ribosomal protein L4